MHSAFVKELLRLKDAEAVKRRIRHERDDLLVAIAQGHVKPDKAVMDQLMEWNIACGDVEADDERE